MTAAAKKLFEALVVDLQTSLLPLAKVEKQIFLLRLECHFQNLYDGLVSVYGDRADFADFLRRLVQKMAACYLARPEDLKLLDLERDLNPDWFQRETMQGYVFYVERFAETIKGIENHLEYLEDLGVTYLHLMKVIKAREGENDGGYAVLDYKEVEPALGSRSDLEHLCNVLRQRGISVCLDLVLNHCAKEHDWALKARAGEKRYQDYFYMFSNRSLPDAYEKTLPEIFPDFAPGNFSFYPEIAKWVWTTFNEYQWDLNWSNPEVFLEIAEILFDLANVGVEIFRLDAVAFMWKRLGTNSQNQPEVFDLLQALRACSRIATPAVTHKAEAIVAPDDLIKYFGVGKHYGKVSNIAYHNSLMVQFWSALASRDTRLMTQTLRDFPTPPKSIAWGNYLRCHDDIGWAVTDEAAAAVGLNGFLHRKFLSDYYAGFFEGSHARGAVFQFNPITQDSRISGTCASLAGLEQAMEQEDETLISLSIERILLGHALIAGFGGIPLLYMGDELGLLNDYGFARVPELLADNRWLHRPFMDWEKAAKRHQTGTIEARIFQGIVNIIRVRKATPQLHSSYQTEIIDAQNPRLFAQLRRHPLGHFLAVYNFSESPQPLLEQVVLEADLSQRYDKLSGRNLSSSELVLKPYERLWLI